MQPTPHLISQRCFRHPMGPSIKVEGFKAEEPKAPIEAEGLSPFELERLATMARNKTVLADLGLAGPSPIALHQEAKQRQRLEKRVSNSKKRKNESTESDAPARRSRRLQGTTVNYTEVHKLTDMLDFCETRMGNRAPKAAKGKKGVVAPGGWLGPTPVGPVAVRVPDRVVPPPQGASGRQLVGGVVGVQNRGVAPPPPGG